MSMYDQILAAMPQHSNLSFIRGDLTVNEPFRPDGGDKTFYSVQIATIGMSFRLACEQLEHAKFAQYDGQEVGATVELTSKDGKQLKIKKIVHLVPMAEAAEAGKQRQRAA